MTAPWAGRTPGIGSAVATARFLRLSDDCSIRRPWKLTKLGTKGLWRRGTKAAGEQIQMNNLLMVRTGLLEVAGLPGTSPERAVLGIRPHTRPILAALQSSSRRLGTEITAEPAELTAIGLPACLAAVNVGAAETLAVPFDGLIPGYECGRCGALGLTADCCPDWGRRRCRCPT